VEDSLRGGSPSPYPLPTERVFQAQTFAESARTLAGLAGAVLGWRPEEFWRATPAELAAVLVAMMPEPPAAVSPADLARLMKRFPDG
jgi:uncharacterized phage protein (TIGR02216 family)